MRDINVIRGKCAFKTAKGHQFKKQFTGKFPMYCEKGCWKSGQLYLVSERGCDSVDFISMGSLMNRVS
jgi:hypothetical protein